jgi:hypothetical protein
VVLKESSTRKTGDKRHGGLLDGNSDCLAVLELR